MKFLWLSFSILFILCAVPANALPKWTREYGMPCAGCHTVAPRLNQFGRAFQANNFSFPGSQLSVRKGSLPISGIALFQAERNLTERRNVTGFRNLKLFVVDPIHFGGSRSGVYYANPVAVSEDSARRSGSVDDLFLTLPVAGSRGQWTVTAGQWMPMLNQWSGHNLFTRSSPAGLDLGNGEFSFAGHMPGIRVDYFDHRGAGTADGNYMGIGLPFHGHLDLRHGSRIDDGRGLFIHGFRRSGPTSIGGFGFVDGKSRLGGLLWTRDFGADYALWMIGGIGRNELGNTRRASIEADRYFGNRLALTGRLDIISGAGSETASAVAVTVFPFKEAIMRATLEFTQRRGNRSIAILARGLF
jgi:hypothetical protein